MFTHIFRVVWSEDHTMEISPDDNFNVNTTPAIFELETVVATQGVSDNATIHSSCQRNISALRNKFSISKCTTYIFSYNDPL